MNLIRDLNYDIEKIKMCRVDIRKLGLGSLQLSMKPCRVMIKRKSGASCVDSESSSTSQSSSSELNVDSLDSQHTHKPLSVSKIGQIPPVEFPSKNIKMCRVNVGKLESSQLIKPCRVMIERKRKSETSSVEKVDECQHVQGRLRINLEPKTIKQRIENDQIFRHFHDGYQDDIFDTLSPIKKQCLLADNSVLSDNENTDCTVSNHSSLGPILSWPVLPTSSTPKKTPLSPRLHSDPSTYQHHAYIHKRLKEKNIVKRIPKKKKMLYNSEEKSRRFDSLVNVVRDSELCREEMDELTHCESYFEFDSEM